MKPTDTVQYALLMMEDFGVANLPVVDEKSLLGYARFDSLDGLDPEIPLSKIEFSGQPVMINHEHSVFSALKLFADNRFDVVAAESGKEYLGLIWVKDVVNSLGQSTTAQNDGSVLLLKCNITDYSISQIGRIIEAEDGKILGIWTWQPEGNHDIEILLKLNIRYIDNITTILESSGYKVLHRVNRKTSDLVEQRYKSLLNYLDI
ncbi:MAG: hypothetical protein JJ975_14345 [Bacteroidia bacterium]|nr:hypothetical protein [Bacteroidia bacterium]